MSEIFLHLVNISITAGWLICAVILLRLVLRKAPRWIFCLLWAMVGLRLLLPFSIESRISLVPSAEPLPESSILSTAPVINSGIPAVDEAVNPVFSESLAPNPGDSVNPLQVWLAVGTAVWVIGVSAMILYSFFSWLRVHRKVHPRLRMRENIFLCDHIDTPFILGIFRPGIYIPSGLPAEHLEPIIAHEKAHLKRLDHLWKPLGFLLLAVYWFNPLVWLAYILLCRDIETACDEKVIRDLAQDGRAAYSEALLCCGTKRRMILVCPLAFGEVGVKDRIKAVLGYKKPAFWILVAALILSLLAGIFFLTNPVTDAAAMSSIKSAAAARETLYKALGQILGSYLRSDILIDCYIDEDYKLCLLLHESARESEPRLRELLKAQKGSVRYEYTDLTKSKLEERALNIRSVLENQGYPVSGAVSSFYGRSITVTMTDRDSLIAASKWAESQKAYPFEDPHVKLEFILNDGKKRPSLLHAGINYIGIDYTSETFYKSEAAGEHLLSWLSEQGGFGAYKDYFQSCCIGTDSLLHVFLKIDGDPAAQEALKSAMTSYGDIVQYHMTGQKEEDILKYTEDLSSALRDLGLQAYGGMIHGSQVLGSGQGRITIDRKDISVAMSLMGTDKPYPFGQTEYFVVFEELAVSDENVPMPTEHMESAFPEPSSAKEEFENYLDTLSIDEIYQDPLNSLKLAVYEGKGLAGVWNVEIVSITLDPEAAKQEIDYLLENKLTEKSREHLEENLLVYQVVFDLDTLENYPVKPLPDGRYQRTIPVSRPEHGGYWYPERMHTPEYLGPIPEKSSDEDSNTAVTEPSARPIVCHYGTWIYDTANTPEGTARSVLENRYYIAEIENIQTDKELTELNLLFPVEQNRLDAYRYSFDFLKEHFQVVTANVISTDGTRSKYMLKMVEDPASGIWELWSIFGYTTDE